MLRPARKKVVFPKTEVLVERIVTSPASSETDALRALEREFESELEVEASTIGHSSDTESDDDAEAERYYDEDDYATTPQPRSATSVSPQPPTPVYQQPYPSPLPPRSVDTKPPLHPSSRVLSPPNHVDSPSDLFPNQPLSQLSPVHSPKSPVAPPAASSSSYELGLWRDRAERESQERRAAEARADDEANLRRQCEAELMDAHAKVRMLQTDNNRLTREHNHLTQQLHVVEQQLATANKQQESEKQALFKMEEILATVEQREMLAQATQQHSMSRIEQLQAQVERYELLNRRLQQQQHSISLNTSMAEQLNSTSTKYRYTVEQLQQRHKTMTALLEERIAHLEERAKQAQLVEDKLRRELQSTSDQLIEAQLQSLQQSTQVPLSSRSHRSSPTGFSNSVLYESTI
eukprot:TRINITY_DN12087_c0_g1_i1.p1 TRINITY_DN12087_c0_g1~~TRINITY_DN12087_c0_g1_i1.p1  ORF type:complete len:406 (-),score=90.37 TRINITY_DN12087_c0_g1_i1:206-1423(-)